MIVVVLHLSFRKLHCSIILERQILRDLKNENLVLLHNEIRCKNEIIRLFKLIFLGIKSSFSPPLSHYNLSFHEGIQLLNGATEWADDFLYFAKDESQ